MNLFWLIIAAAVGTGVAYYNKFKSIKEAISESWLAVDTQLKKRHDLILMLSESSEGNASQEKFVIDNLFKLINESRSKIEPTEKAKIESEISQQIKKLLMSESQNIRSLESALVEVEGNISSSRAFYNGIVGEFNHLLVTFPSNYVANVLSYEAIKPFEVDLVSSRKA